MHITKIATAPSPAACAAKKNAAQTGKSAPGNAPNAAAPATATNAAAPASITALAQAQVVSSEGGRVVSAFPFSTTAGGLDIRV